MRINIHEQIRNLVFNAQSTSTVMSARALVGTDQQVQLKTLGLNEPDTYGACSFKLSLPFTADRYMVHPL